MTCHKIGKKDGGLKQDVHEARSFVDFQHEQEKASVIHHAFSSFTSPIWE